MIYQLKITDHTTRKTKLRHNLKWLTTDNAINYKLLTLTYKTLIYGTPHLLRILFKIKQIHVYLKLTRLPQYKLDIR